METRLDSTGTRSILSTLDEYRAAVAEIAKRANRSLSIYTPNLEPLIYDQDMFLEPLKRLVLARGHARLRVLISDPARVMREGNRFMQMARRLTSFIELRNVPRSSAAIRPRSSSPTPRPSPTVSSARAGTASSNSTTSRSSSAISPTSTRSGR